MTEYTHKPVLLRECLEGLSIRPDGIYVDGTLGRAGHSLEIARRLTTGRLIAVDRYKAALDASPALLGDRMDRVTLVRGNFGDLPEILASMNVAGVDGMLFDLGVSSPQLDDGSRGFSYLQDAPLDMRMDQSAPLTARDVVNGWSQEDLKRILWQYGEERYSGLIAAAIAHRREGGPIETTGQLAQLIRDAMPAKARREKQHPAKRSFQAIRIAVNDELTAAQRVIDQAVPRLAKGGRLCVITFHSLEDRIVKNGYAAAAKGCTCPPDFPVCVCGKKPSLRLVNKKPILPSQKELEEKGKKPVSQTDSEIAAMVIDDCYRGNPEEAIRYWNFSRRKFHVFLEKTDGKDFIAYYKKRVLIIRLAFEQYLLKNPDVKEGLANGECRQGKNKA